MIFSLKNKLALITGGGAGIGLEIARCMIAAGARVVITGRTESKLITAVKDLGPSALYRIHDVTAHSTHEALIRELEENVGDIDILVNNAGINMKKNALEVSNEEFASIINTNLNSVFALTRVTAKSMVKRGKGVILMISSMAAYYGIDRVVAYAASKSGIEGMVKVLASDLSPNGIRINAIAPGFIETSMMKTAFGSDPDRMHKAMDRTPLGRFGKPEDVGWAAVYLASDEANFITGVSLRVDGGNAIGF
ncbi:short-chain dehydrogenase/reductase SDR [Leadbetterella byssophila DSM 17132]|uniref:Short-chain dehydrogenase/reductase SDR n=1 Tax=Leadbetterella byssophila (strain DSM 17132 / JCM 16389 / KACC 11308 / NBRC 106382 / 4M15) TaxID=649349 RepID=E4RWD2_LEAB4|nr:glucose 1-dehydrogenase [Leadbetterella byssophila]ADQ18005.1 short-chain dehydrogenase/reductase SDR [Leadbetterella byssophila DSM 17132]